MRREPKKRFYANGIEMKDEEEAKDLFASELARGYHFFWTKEEALKRAREYEEKFNVEFLIYERKDKANYLVKFNKKEEHK